MNTKVIAIVNQKGGCGKTGTSVNLSAGLAGQGKKVLLIDNDPQGSATASFGYVEQDNLEVTLCTILDMVRNDEDFPPETGIIHTEEQVDLMPASMDLSGMEAEIVNEISREHLLSNYIEQERGRYDYIIIDCMPSLGMLTINALTAADSVIIPVQAAYLSLKGLESLIGTLKRVKRRLNRGLTVDGILISMVDKRTTYARDIIKLIHDVYGDNIHIFNTMIPFSVRAAESSAKGVSIFKHDPKGKVAAAYKNFTEEVMNNE